MNTICVARHRGEPIDTEVCGLPAAAVYIGQVNLFNAGERIGLCAQHDQGYLSLFKTRIEEDPDFPWRREVLNEGIEIEL